MNMLRIRSHDEHVDNVSGRRLHTYIHKYSDFLIVLMSVALASARPNNGIHVGRILLFIYNLTTMWLLNTLVKDQQ